MAKGSCAQNLQLAPLHFLGVWFSNVTTKPSEFTTTLTSTYSPGQWVLYYLDLSAMPKLYYYIILCLWESCFACCNSLRNNWRSVGKCQTSCMEPFITLICCHAPDMFCRQRTFTRLSIGMVGRLDNEWIYIFEWTVPLSNIWDIIWREHWNVSPLNEEEHFWNQQPLSPHNCFASVQSYEFLFSVQQPQQSETFSLTWIALH